MNIWAIIPIKSLTHTKTRLANVLTPTERANLTICLYRRLLKVLQQLDAIEQIVVVSRDVQINQIAEEHETSFIQEPPQADLNQSIAYGVNFAKHHGASHALILPSDLPLVTKADLSALLDQAKENHLLICSDGAQTGTNALLLPLNVIFQFRYGLNSFEQHIVEATRSGLAVGVYTNRALQFDLDTEDDWYAYQLNQLSDE